MHALAIIFGVILIGVILVDAFETIILPRGVARKIQLSRLFLNSLWGVWLWVAKLIRRDQPIEGASRQDRFLGVFGPLVLLLLLAAWAMGLVFGYALVHWGLGELQSESNQSSFGTSLYLSGTTFFTLGLGDVVPSSSAGRFLTVVESATGFSFLAAVISYLPVIYAAFATREVPITLLDARAGSPPAAAELLRRFGQRDSAILDTFLRDWELWCAGLLESHLSYPVLSFFRSQHEQQSWLAALTMVLDTGALMIVGIEDEHGRLPDSQAKLTFAMARHAAGDLSQVLGSSPTFDDVDRLPPDRLAELRTFLADAGIPLREGEAADRQLAEIRSLYEPYVIAISRRFRFLLPPWIPTSDATDDWETTAWQSGLKEVRRALGPEPIASHD